MSDCVSCEVKSRFGRRIATSHPGVIRKELTDVEFDQSAATLRGWGFAALAIDLGSGLITSSTL